MLPLFTYGALMYQPIWLNVVQQHCTPIPAVAQGYLRCVVKNSKRCALVPASPEARVSGMLYGGLTPDHVRRLDQFAGELYERAEVKVATATDTILAQTFYLKPEYKELVQNYCWDQRVFERDESHAVMNQNALFMAAQPSRQMASSYQ